MGRKINLEDSKKALIEGVEVGTRQPLLSGQHRELAPKELHAEQSTNDEEEEEEAQQAQYHRDRLGQRGDQIAQRIPIPYRQQ